MVCRYLVMRQSYGRGERRRPAIPLAIRPTRWIRLPRTPAVRTTILGTARIGDRDCPSGAGACRPRSALPSRHLRVRLPEYRASGCVPPARSERAARQDELLLVGEDDFRKLLSRAVGRPGVPRAVGVDDRRLAGGRVFGDLEQVEELTVHVPDAARALEADGADPVRRVA